jgi:transposase
MDIHRTFAEVLFWEAGRLRSGGRVDMTRSGLKGFGRNLSKEHAIVIEAKGNAMAVARLLGPHVARVIVANPLQVKAIAHAHIKTDKIDARVPPLRTAAGPRARLFGGKQMYLWRAVDAEGEVLEVLVQPKRDKAAAPETHPQSC